MIKGEKLAPDPLPVSHNRPHKYVNFQDHTCITSKNLRDYLTQYVGRVSEREITTVDVTDVTMSSPGYMLMYPPHDTD